MKRILAILLLLVMCLPLLACPGAGEDPAGPGADSSEYKFLDSIPEELNGKYRGREFVVSINDNYKYEMYADETSKELVDQKVRKRNDLVEDRFGVDIQLKITVPQSGAMHTAHRDYVNNCLMNGQNDFDLIMQMAYTAGQTITDGNYLDWRSYTTYSAASMRAGAEWWPKQINDDATIMGRQYLAVSDLCLTAMESAYAVVFNKDLVHNDNLSEEFFGTSTLYEAVDEELWTLENFRVAVKDKYYDSDAGVIGQIDDQDTFGMVASRMTDVDAWAYALGFYYIENDGDNAPMLWDVDDRVSQAVNALRLLYSDTNENRGVYTCEKGGVEPGTYTWQNQFFADGHAFFNLTPLIQLKSNVYHEMDAAFGVLPFPKLDDAQTEYRTGLLDYYTTLAIPVFDSRSVELIDIMVEALSAESANSVRETYYNATVKLNNADATEDMRMIDLIMENRVFDLSVYHYNQITRTPALGNNFADQALGTMFRYLIRRDKTIAASTYWTEQCRDLMQGQLEEIVAEYEAMAKG